MNCAFDKEKLSGYYDGELDAAEKAEVERHIASCSECLRELGELKSAAILVKELPRLRAPRSVAEGVRKEIQAAGRVHSFARARRTVMWAASAAAALFIGINLIYFSSRSETPAPDVAARATSSAPVLGRAMPSEAPSAAEAPEPVERRRVAAQEEAQQGARLEESRKNELREQDRKKLDAAPAAKAEAESKDREKAAAPRAEEKKPTNFAAPSAPAPAPKPADPARPPAVLAPPPAPGAPATATARPMKEESKAAEAPADKAPARKDGDSQAGLKQKAAADAPDPGPSHLTLATTQMAKSRPEMAEALKRMGLTLPPPPSAAMVKGVARSGAREETVYQFELTEAQIARLRAEFEKPGTSALVTGRPEDPVMAQFKRGGVYEAKKDVASGGAAGKKFGDPKTDAPKETKEGEDVVVAKVAAEGAVEKPGEPRRKVVLHFLEVPFMPDRQPASDALKK